MPCRHFGGSGISTPRVLLILAVDGGIGQFYGVTTPHVLLILAVDGGIGQFCASFALPCRKMSPVSTGLFKMIVTVLTTCHTHYT